MKGNLFDLGASVWYNLYMITKCRVNQSSKVRLVGGSRGRPLEVIETMLKTWEVSGPWMAPTKGFHTEAAAEVYAAETDAFNIKFPFRCPISEREHKFAKSMIDRGFWTLEYVQERWLYNES